MHFEVGCIAVVVAAAVVVAPAIVGWFWLCMPDFAVVIVVVAVVVVFTLDRHFYPVAYGTPSVRDEYMYPTRVCVCVV